MLTGEYNKMNYPAYLPSQLKIQRNHKTGIYIVCFKTKCLAYQPSKITVTEISQYWIPYSVLQNEMLSLPTFPAQNHRDIKTVASRKKSFKTQCLVFLPCQRFHTSGFNTVCFKTKYLASIPSQHTITDIHTTGIHS